MVAQREAGRNLCDGETVSKQVPQTHRKLNHPLSRICRTRAKVTVLFKLSALFLFLVYLLESTLRMVGVGGGGAYLYSQHSETGGSLSSRPAWPTAK